MRYFKDIFSSTNSPIPDDLNSLITNSISPKQHDNLCCIPTTLGIKDIVSCMKNGKSPGPCGFITCFFKRYWYIIANDVILAIKHFFRNGNMLKSLNHT